MLIVETDGKFELRASDPRGFRTGSEMILEPGGTTVPSVTPAAQMVTPGTKVTITATGQATAQRFAWAAGV